jgi:hypothetical protein
VEEAKEGEKWRGEVRGSDGGDAKGGFGGFFCEGNGCGYIFGGASVGGEKESTVFFFWSEGLATYTSSQRTIHRTCYHINTTPILGSHYSILFVVVVLGQSHTH